MKNYLRANDAILQGIKYNARKDWINNIGHNGEENLKITMDIWWRPEVRNRMKGFVEQLTTKK